MAHLSEDDRYIKNILERAAKLNPKDILMKIGQWDMTTNYPPYADEQVKKVFEDELTQKTWNTTGEGFEEDASSVSAGRVYGETLYNSLVTRDGKNHHWFDISYRNGFLKKFTEDSLGVQVYPMDDINASYTGNALVNPEDWFPVHRDSKRTRSTVLFFPWEPAYPRSSNEVPMRERYITYDPEGDSDIVAYQGGEFVISFNPHTKGLNELKWNSSSVICPNPKGIVAVTFDGALAIHGSLPIPPRF